MAKRQFIEPNYVSINHEDIREFIRLEYDNQEYLIKVEEGINPSEISIVDVYLIKRRIRGKIIGELVENKEIDIVSAREIKIDSQLFHLSVGPIAAFQKFLSLPHKLRNNPGNPRVVNLQV